MSKVQYYIEVTDKRVDLDPPYVWQSDDFKTIEAAEKLGRQVREGLNKNDMTVLTRNKKTGYLNSSWVEYCDLLPRNKKGLQTNLKVDVMVMEFSEDDSEYEIGFVKRLV